MNDIIKGLQAMQDKYNELTNKLSDKEKILVKNAVAAINSAGTDQAEILKVRDEQLEIIKNLENGN